MNFADFVRKECPALAPTPSLPHGIALVEIEAEFSRDPDWQKIKDDSYWLHHLGEALHFRRLRERGEIPPTYTAVRECRECGPVLLEPWSPEKGFRLSMVSEPGKRTANTPSYTGVCASQ